MALPIADRWFERTRVDDRITLLWEPHVVPLMRCNIWHVAGRDRNLIVDTGMGVASLVDALGELADKAITAVATHGHDDHIGSHHEFDEVLMHPSEASVFDGPLLDSLEDWLGISGRLPKPALKKKIVVVKKLVNTFLT